MMIFISLTVVEKSELSKLLPWVHTTISNAKKLLLDMHHRIDNDFLQNYLNEFCFKWIEDILIVYLKDS